jgi:hypothetical protein
MKSRLLLFFTGMAFASLIVNRVYSDATPVPTSQTPHLTPSPTPQPRVDINSADADVQPPTDNSDDLGFYAGSSIGNTSSRSAIPSGTGSLQATPENAETMQSTVTAILSNPGLTTVDELAPQPSPSSRTNPITKSSTNNTNLSKPTPTNLTLQPTNTPVPSLTDKY